MTSRRVRRDARGSAVVEFIWLVLLLMVPLVYLLLAVFDVQRASYGAAAASRAAGRAFVLSPDEQTAVARAEAAARVALSDQGVEWSTADMQVGCSPSGGLCLVPGGRVTVVVTVQQPVPLAPSVFGETPPTIRVSSSHVEPYGTFREPRP